MLDPICKNSKEFFPRTCIICSADIIPGHKDCGSVFLPCGCDNIICQVNNEMIISIF